ncbi:MAG: hypothetical protein PHC68_04205 [Syntrophorhabdaceae bacterium]|nr:hypothetical protein [Syntrophorhabdaceae bacterium]
MRHIQIPNPVTLRNVVDAKNEPIAYGLKMLNEQNVFNKPVWREKGKFEMFLSIYNKFDATKYSPGAIVSLTDEEFEVYSPLAIMKGQDLNSAMAYELLQVMKAIINATSERPEILPKAETSAEVKN